MALQEGEVYRCSDPGCNCEVTVTRGADHAASSSDQNPRCCCNAEMQRVPDAEARAS